MNKLAELEKRVSAINAKLADKDHHSPGQLSVLRKAKSKLLERIEKIKDNLKSNDHESPGKPTATANSGNQNSTGEQWLHRNTAAPGQISLW